MGQNYYSLLGLSPDATPDEIRTAYFEAARRLHPDANPAIPSNEQFIRVQEAYEILSHAQRRAEYDAQQDDEFLSQPAISTHIRTSRSQIQRISEPQIVYLLLELACTAEETASKRPFSHVCLVIDRSTSMQGARIDMVKASISQAVKLLKPQDIVSVVAFCDRAEVIIPPTRVSAFSKIEDRIFEIQTSGGTELFQGMSAGMDVLRSTGTNQMLRQLILLTDGHTYGDEAACLALANQAHLEGIGISALGLGNEWNDAFLDQLTAISGGNAVLITSAQELTRSLEQKLNFLNAVYARGITLGFRFDPAVELRYAFRLVPEINAISIENPLSLGNLQNGKSMTILLELLINPLPEGTDLIQLFSGWLKMQLFERGLKRTRLFIDTKCAVRDGLEPENPPAVIVEALSRLTLYKLQERAREEVRTGNINQATRHLQYLATHLLSRGNRDLAHTVLAEAEHIRQMNAFSKDGDKRIKYGTRALMLPAGSEVRS
jgi:Ca-activated chloride channel homolog